MQGPATDTSVDFTVSARRGANVDCSLSKTFGCMGLLEIVLLLGQASCWHGMDGKVLLLL